MIEAKIDALIAALEANTAAHQGKVAPATDKPAAAKAPAAAKVAASPAAAPAAPAVTYEQIKAPFLDLVAKAGRDHALTVIAPLTNLKEAKPEQFADILAKLTAAHTAHAAQAALA